MTRKEAKEIMLKLLSEITKDFDVLEDEEKEAFNKAIEALEQEPCDCDDAVNRQAVDEIKELMTDINGDTVYVARMSDIRKLPPVRPQPCTDAVSREAVKAYKYHRTMYPNFEDYVDMLPSVRPQEPKTGRWIEHDCETLRVIGYYRCSECNHGYQRYERGVRKSEVPYINGQKYELHKIDNFCPNCGARMESEQNE